MEFKEELWWQNLEEWIFDESKLISYKYVASSLKIHVNVAKKMLFTYNKESTRKTFAIYLVSGSINGECHVKLISDKDIEKEESKFDHILSKHVYALGQPSVFDANDLSGMLHLSSINDSPNDILPYRGVVCDKSLQIRDNKEIITESELKPEEVIKKDISSPAKKTTKEEEASAPEKKPLVKEVATKAAKKPSAGKSNAIKSMFAKAPPKKEKQAEEKSEDKTENPSQSKPDSPGKENKASQESSCPSSNNTSEAKLNKAAINNKTSSTKRRKRIQVMSDSDSSDNEEPEPVDNFHEQSPIKEGSPEELMDTLPATPAAEEIKSTKGSRRTRKLINKTFVDESGFLVTKKEYASCSEEDEPAPSPPKKVQNEEKPKSTSTTAPSPSKANKKQSSIKNFFTKK